LLDSYGGTLIVISHDRYFLERVCDRFVGLLGDKTVRDLPRGVDEYLEQRAAVMDNTVITKTKAISSAAEQRQIKKDIVRLERQIQKIDERIYVLMAEQEISAFDFDRLLSISQELSQINLDKIKLEEEWLSATLAIDYTTP